MYVCGCVCTCLCVTGVWGWVGGEYAYVSVCVSEERGERNTLCVFLCTPIFLFVTPWWVFRMFYVVVRPVVFSVWLPGNSNFTLP